MEGESSNKSEREECDQDSVLSNMPESETTELSRPKDETGRESRDEVTYTAERLRKVRADVLSKFTNVSPEEWPRLQNTFRMLSEQIEKEESAAHARATQMQRLIISATFSTVLIASGIFLISLGNSFGFALIGIGIGLFSKPFQKVMNLFQP